jgi:hypothetical protein
MATRFVCIHFCGSYSGTLGVLIGFAFGCNKWVRLFLAAPCATTKSLYDSEMALYRLSMRFSEDTYELTALGRVEASVLPVALWSVIVVQAVSFSFGGVGFGNTCVMFFCCFNVLSAVVRQLDKGLE